MPKFDSIDDRMKFYEKNFNGNYLMPMVPAIVRLDGRAFHSFCRGLDKPFSPGLMQCMKLLTKALVLETNAVIGYTQSDEITLVLNQNDYKSQLYMDGKTQKINSLLAGRATLEFNSLVSVYLPMQIYKRPQFDCRSFSVPNKQEAINCLIWRQQDATRNSIQMVGQANFSHKELQKKSCSDIQEMLFTQKGINWNNLTPDKKRGAFFCKTDLGITESSPILTQISNQEGFVFNKEEPLDISEERSV